MCVRACACVCVCERERKRESEGENLLELFKTLINWYSDSLNVVVYAINNCALLEDINFISHPVLLSLSIT